MLFSYLFFEYFVNIFRRLFRLNLTRRHRVKGGFMKDM